MLQPITIRPLQSKEEITACQHLRVNVWRDEGVNLSQTGVTTFAAHDEHALHWGAYSGTDLIGASRLCIHDNVADAPDGHMFIGLNLFPPIASMNCLVVAKQFRNNGVGGTLDRVRIDSARILRAGSVIVAPVDVAHRTTFLQKLGFTLTDRVEPSAWSKTVLIRAAFLTL